MNYVRKYLPPCAILTPMVSTILDPNIFKLRIDPYSIKRHQYLISVEALPKKLPKICLKRKWKSINIKNDSSGIIHRNPLNVKLNIDYVHTSHIYRQEQIWDDLFYKLSESFVSTNDDHMINITIMP